MTAWGKNRMRPSASGIIRLRQIVLFLLCLVTALCLLPVSASHAETQKKTVRVGWYDSTFNTMDSIGRRSGYAYEYQLKIAAYTGWNYEYVYGSWSTLLQMLVDGDIDLMSDVSYTEERAQKMLFADLPMGSEEYYLFTSPDNQEINSLDYSSLNGKLIGVNKDSIQADLYRDWAERNGVQAELVELVTSENESLKMLQNGYLDAYVTVDSFTEPERAVPVFKVGASDFYFAVTNNRPDLLAELNTALNRIQTENRFFHQDMYEKYINTAGANALLAPNESDWLNGHGPIRVGYKDDYLAFCSKDKTTGELTGALKDYLTYASDCLPGTHIPFEPVAYDTVEEALTALHDNEVDCVFPINLSGYDGESRGVVVTMPMMRTEIYAIVRQRDLNTFPGREHVVVAVNEGNPNYDAYLLDHFPGWHKVYYRNTDECLKAVSKSIADCVLISSFRYNNLARLCEKYNLTSFPTSEGLDFSFAVENGNTELYSIMTKIVSNVPESASNSALSYYISEDARRTLGDFLSENLAIVMIVIAVVLLLIVFLLIRSMKAVKKARQLIAVTETDVLTGLYNREYFLQYAERLQREHSDTPMDAIMLDIEQFHSINALRGWDFGDQVLRVLGNELRMIADENGGIACRFGADRFEIYCRHISDYQALYDRLQNKLEGMAPFAGIRLRMGACAGQKEQDSMQLLDMARTACSRARGHYKEHLIIFDEKMHEKEMLGQRLLGELHRAINSYELEVYYQPKFDIKGEHPKLFSAEALIRWNHPELGMLTPDLFIPLLEQNGKIVEVDKFVWSQAARQIARWRGHYGVSIPISVNLSRIDVFDPELERTLDSILSQNGIEHDLLRLEVTESAYTENADQLIKVVKSLRKKGYTIEMDDFGSGYSSLNMLSSLPIDILKMDRAFITNIEKDEKDVQLVALIIEIAKKLNIPVIAEGVETESQLKVLKQMGCTLVQGYYFSRPIHPSEFETEFLSGRGEVSDR